MPLIKALFKKKKKEVEIVSPISGNLAGISDLSDDVFSKKLMGDGFFVQPQIQPTLEIASPIPGLIENVFETKHAISIRNEETVVLLHLGLDTVEMKGLPFEILVEPNETVTEGQLIAKMKLEEVFGAGKTAEIIVVFPESSGKKLTIEKNGEVIIGKPIGSIQTS